MSTPTQPFIGKTGTEVLEELIEHITAGIVVVNNEAFDVDGVGPYTLVCGAPDISDGQLIEVNRVWGIRDNSFTEFSEGAVLDYTVDLTNNQITFTEYDVDHDRPDDNTIFYVSYRYDQKFTSGITEMAIGSVARTLIDATARQIGALYTSLAQLKAAAFIDTAVGDDLDDLLKLVGITRNEASPADGFVTFYRDVTAGTDAVPIGASVAGRRTEGDILFETTEEVIFDDGFSSIRAPVEAIDRFKGRESNMGANLINRIVGGAGPATRCNNPASYSDYEFIDLVDGDYSYSLASTPHRTLTGTTFPWAATDRGCLSIVTARDTSISTANWSTSDVDITEDVPQVGETKCEPTATTGYIDRTFSIVPSTYPHIIVMTRGKNAEQFSVQFEDSTSTNTVSMFEFGSTSSGTMPEFRTDWTMYVGAHGNTGTVAGTMTCRILFHSIDTSWLDFFAVGQNLDVVQPAQQNSEEEAVLNYTSRNVGLWFEDANNNAFEVFDGDASDGHIDRLFAFYQWNNFVSGGGDEENDDNLRLRGREALDVAAKGTKDAIINAVLDIEGISQCEVTDYNSDPNIDPGVIHVYVLARGFTVSPSLSQSIVVAVDGARAAGIQAKIFAPEIRYVNFTINVIYDDANPDYAGDAGQSGLKSVVDSTMNDFFADAEINEALYFSDLCGYIISEIEGVVAAYITWTTSSEPQVSDDYYSGSYAWDDDICLTNPDRIYGLKKDELGEITATIVVQRGDRGIETGINLVRKSDSL